MESESNKCDSSSKSLQGQLIFNMAQSYVGWRRKEKLETITIMWSDTLIRLIDPTHLSWDLSYISVKTAKILILNNPVI